MQQSRLDRRMTIPADNMEKMKPIISRKDNTLTITLPDKLDIHTVPGLWEQCVPLAAKHKPETLVIDCAKVIYCDGAGISLLQALEKRQKTIKKTAVIQNFKPEFKNLLDFIEKQHSDLSAIQEEEDYRLRILLGQWGADIAQQVKNNLIFLGKASYYTIQSFLHSKQLNRRAFWRALEETGVQALPLILVIGFLIGLISTFQSAPTLGQFGARIYVINLVALGLMREMGPLMTAMLLAGRTASAFAAELGTMKINQEIDALSTMGLNPIKFLVVPRILAAMIVTPFLNIFLIFAGLLGCAVVMYSLGYPFDIFTQQLYEAVRPKDYWGGLIKVFAFGIVIAGIGCLNGLNTKRDAKAVGHSTTRAVVSSIIMTVIVDGVFALVYYTLGI